MLKAYKYKLKTTVKQRKALLNHFGCCRYIYNWGLERKISQYKTDKKSLSYVALAKELTQLKKQEETKWLQKVAAESLQQSLKHLDAAFKRFFKEKKGFPNFKKRGCCKETCKFIQHLQIDFSLHRVKLPIIGWVNIRKNKQFDCEQCNIKSMTASMDKCGTIYVSVLIETNEPCKPKTKVCRKTAVGIDMGIKDFVTLSNGIKYPNKRFLNAESKKLKRLQQRFAKTTIGSRRRERLRLHIAKIYNRIANRRSNYIHDITSSLIKTYDTICLEDLNIQGMMKNHTLARAIGDVAWHEFKRQLLYKAEWHGKNVLFINRYMPSSKRCSCCGYEYKRLTLNVRKWTCPECKVVHDRGINAALNIKAYAFESLFGEVVPQVSGTTETSGKGNNA